MAYKEDPNWKRKVKKHSELALELTADLIAGEIDPETPFSTGALSMSAFQGGKRTKWPDDKNTLKLIRYAVPYAVKVYTGLNLNFTTDKHKRAQAFWGRALMNNKTRIEQIANAAFSAIGRL